jgi:DNA invertase Pin-like site-specific DNA recombinase
MLMGYARVSKADGTQTSDLQHDALIAAGVDAAQIYENCASGKREDRPGLDSCLRALRDGDTLVVWKLDRLGRDLAHLVATVRDLEARGVGFRVLAGQGAEIDTRTAGGRLIFGFFAALAEFERDLIRERVNAGLAAARAHPRSARRCPLQDDARQTAAGAGRHGQARNQRQRALPRTRHLEPDPLPPRLAGRRPSPGRPAPDQCENPKAPSPW